MRKLNNLESQYYYEKQSLNDELSQVENLLREKELRLFKLSFLQFMEKRTFNADLDELKKKKQNNLKTMFKTENDQYLKITTNAMSGI